ncbi:transcriptional regulator, RpiR family [Enterovibrio norvegicus DSM 15893]|uniref:Transcriptional regulator, RpiR family n=1 Tax=Enterovibrio norvegicus DSM 15893 TaxID=1121869 RepID=A0A1I5V369_9GAMM|nr:transcriptional regulator, RpiR family [Enterovibrio norvegicus DSM 15893]
MSRRLRIWEKFPMDRKTFISKVNGLDSLTSEEVLIAQYFMKHYTMLPFAKIDELCKQIGVGKATLGRFLQRLGFSGFLEFKKQVSNELALTLTTPVERYEGARQADQGQSVLESHAKEIMSNMAKTFSSLSESDFDLAIVYMQNPRGKLYVVGSASSEALANYFYLLTTAAHVAMPMQLAAGLMRSASPVAGVVIACAGVANVSPIELAKRTMIPMLGGLLSVLVCSQVLI